RPTPRGAHAAVGRAPARDRARRARAEPAPRARLRDPVASRPPGPAAPGLLALEPRELLARGRGLGKRARRQRGAQHVDRPLAVAAPREREAEVVADPSGSGALVQRALEERHGEVELAALEPHPPERVDGLGTRLEPMRA